MFTPSVHTKLTCSAEVKEVLKSNNKKLNHSELHRKMNQVCFLFIVESPGMESQVTPNAESSKKIKTDSSSEVEIFNLQVSEKLCSFLISTWNY